MQEQQTVVPQAAPITVQVPQPAAIIQRQVIQSYYTPPQVLVNSVCGYGCDGGQSFGSQVIINRSGSSRSRGSERVIINDRSRVRSNQRINVQVREKQGLFRNRSSTKVFIRGR
jgi:hypothetical protein